MKGDALPGIFAAALMAMLTACQTGPASGPASPPSPPAAPQPSPAAFTPAGGDMMGGMALGGSAKTELLASDQVAALPSGPLAWIGHVSASPAAPIVHRHALGFVYATDGSHTVTMNGRSLTLQSGQALFVGQGVEHTHAGPGRFWEIGLAAPNTGPPPRLENAKVVFASPPLEGVPQPPVRLNFILVELLPGGETSVHTHPGPEYIYVTRGDIVYQNPLIGTTTMRTGDAHALPPNTAVQKRNPGKEKTAFLSWFVVDPAKPFAPRATFATGPAARPAGRNVASLGAGARIAGVSSNYGGEGNTSAYGANNAIDEDAATEWSSNGDGNKAWIEIELAQPYRILRIGFWTRTMGSTAQIQQFEVVADGKTKLGPFRLPGAAGIHYFTVNVTAKRLRFSALKSSGGNTGAVEIEALTAP